MGMSAIFFEYFSPPKRASLIVSHITLFSTQKIEKDREWGWGERIKTSLTEGVILSIHVEGRYINENLLSIACDKNGENENEM